MGPTPETCVTLLRSLRSLLGLKQVAVQRAAHDSLPYAAFGLLAELGHRGECRASELAAYRIVDASVISRQVAQLEQAGLITRRPDPSDKRVALLRTTEAGENELREAERRNSEFIRHALREWDDEHVRQLAELLRAATGDIRDVLCLDGESEMGECPR